MVIDQEYLDHGCLTERCISVPSRGSLLTVADPRKQQQAQAKQLQGQVNQLQAKVKQLQAQ